MHNRPNQKSEVTCSCSTVRRQTQRRKEILLQGKFERDTKGNLVLKKVVLPTQHGKLQTDGEGPYRIYHKLPHRAYKLQELNNRHSLLNSVSTYIL